MISGWFGIKPSIRGLSNFLFQCLFFLIGIYAVSLLCGRAQLSGRGLLECLCLTRANWFIKAYLALYIISPIINTFLEKANHRQLEVLLIAYYIFQTIWGWSGAAAFIAGGYSCFSFIGLYILAHYLRRYQMRFARYGLLIYLITVALNSALYYLQFKLILVPYTFDYCNPLVVIGAASLIMWFSTLKIGHSRSINVVAKSAFAAFLLHSNPNLSESVYKHLVKHIYNTYSGVKSILIIGAMVIAVFAIAILIDRVRLLLWKPIAHRLPDLKFSAIR